MCYRLGNECVVFILLFILYILVVNVASMPNFKM